MSRVGRGLGWALGAGALLVAAVAVGRPTPEASLRLTLALDTLSADEAAALDRQVRAAVELPGRAGDRPRLRLSRAVAAAGVVAPRPPESRPLPSSPVTAPSPARAAVVRPVPVEHGAAPSPPRATDFSQHLLQDAEPLLRRLPPRAVKAFEGRTAPALPEGERVFVHPESPSVGPSAAPPARRAGSRVSEVPDRGSTASVPHPVGPPPGGPHPVGLPPGGPRPPLPPAGPLPRIGGPPGGGPPPAAPPPPAPPPSR